MSDVLLRAIDREAGLRVITAITTELCIDAATRHHAEGVGACALGRALTASLLLGTLTKAGERVTVQIRGDGPLGALIVDAQIDPAALGTVRGYAMHPERATEPCSGRAKVAGAVGGHGVINVVRDLGLKDRYQGEVALTTGEVDEDVEGYLRQSEQVSSALGCDLLFDGPRIVAAAGILVQALPGSEADAVAVARQAIRGGAVYEFLARGGRSAQALAEEVYGRPLELFGEQPLAFRCRCSQERIEDMLAMLGTIDLDEMIAGPGHADITCNFCNTTWTVERPTLERIRAELARRPRGSA